MYRATYPPIRVITAAQQTWNLRITSRRSSGSSLTARADEPTRSQKRTVSWRLSASDCGRGRAAARAAAAAVARGARRGGGGCRAGQRGDRPENPFSMAERDAQFLQIGLGHVGQDFEIDGVLGKDGRVLPEPDLIEPSRYAVIGTHYRASPIPQA